MNFNLDNRVLESGKAREYIEVYEKVWELYIIEIKNLLKNKNEEGEFFH